MQIEDFKRWHWIAISIVVGAALSYLWLNLPAGEMDGARRGISGAELFRDLQLGKTDKGFPLIQNLVINPAQSTTEVGTDKLVRTNYVTGEYLEPTKPGKGMYRRFSITAEVPFKPPGARAAPNETYTIRDHIDQLAKSHPDIRYRYAWWNMPAAIVAIWGGGSLLLIGGVWPTVLGLMIGAGLGRPKTEKKEEYNLDRVGQTSAEEEDITVKPGAKTVTAEDHDKLRQLQETLERNLAAAGVTQTAPADTPAAGATPVKKLDGVPLESAAALQNQDNAPKQYGGEFYPVVRPGHHKTDET
jgi:hypothetical protein